MNGVILQPQWSAAAKAIGRSATVSTTQIVAFNLWGFAAGIIAVWLYAAMRPRFGAGPRTAITADTAVWLLAYAVANAMMAFLHVFPLGLLVLVTAVGLLEVLIAATAGAYIYREA